MLSCKDSLLRKLCILFKTFWTLFYIQEKSLRYKCLNFIILCGFLPLLSSAVFNFNFFQTNYTMLNKYFFAAIALLFALSAPAQAHFQKPIPKVSGLKPMPYLKNMPVPEILTPELTNQPEIISGVSDRNAEEVVGITRWDAQGYGSVPSRVYYKPNGEPAATWTFATDGTNAFPERGTGYSSRSNGTWSPSTARIESIRTGFPSASILSDGTEVVVAHATATSPYKLRFSRRAAGATAWTETDLETPPGIGCLWPHLTVGGPDGKTIHLIAITTPTGNTGVVYQGINGHVLYWRSLDGGLTWDKKYVIIPGLDMSKFTAHASDEYNLDANGSTVGIAVFPAWNDLLVFKSYDNGDTWETITARDFPDALENYAGLDGDGYTIDDVGPLDPNAPDSLAIFSSDGSGNVLIDDAGEVHLFFGRMYYSDTDPAAGSSFYPGINGLVHWKESFGTDTYQIITGALDYDGDGQLGITTTDDIAPYYESLSSMPSSGLSADGTIYVGYAALHELYRSSNANLQFFRHTYLIKSADNGENWGDPLDLIAAPYISDTVLIPFVESVYPMLPRHIGSKVGLVYQQDYDAGIHLLGPSAAGNHDFVDNSLLWVEVDPSDIPGTSGTFTPKNPELVLSITPNPASSNALVTANFSGNEDVLVEVVDLMGRCVFHSNMKAATGRQVLAIPVQNLLAGNYWVRVTEGSQFGITKLVVAK
jgi:hypothetical protein